MNECAHVLPLELDAGGEVVLHASPALAAELHPLVQSLLAEGFDARVITDAVGFDAALRDAETPVLHVVCRRAGEVDLDTMRARARELSDVDHGWLDAPIGSDAPLRLLSSIMRSATDLEVREPGVVVERVDVDDVSNVVLLPTPKPERPPVTKRAFDWRFAAIGVLCGGVVAALAFVAGGREHETVSTAPHVVTRSVYVHRAERRVVVEEPAPAPASEPSVTPVVEPEPAPEPEPEPAPDSPLQRAIASGKATLAADLVVSPMIDPGLDWYRATSTCRVRRFHGVAGWSLPTRTQLVALARARALPDASLWTRNKGDREGNQAIAVSGRAGLGRAVPKSSTDVAIVCVQPSPPQE